MDWQEQDANRDEGLTPRERGDRSDRQLIPWANTGVRMKPIGLREAVLRASYAPGQADRDPRGGPPLFAIVRGWQRGEGATKEQWDELERLVRLQQVVRSRKRS